MECSTIFIIKAQIAQLVEQWIEDPRVPSSNLGLGIFVLFTISVNFNDEVNRYLYANEIKVVYSNYN